MEVLMLALSGALNYVLAAVGFALGFGSLRILKAMDGGFVKLWGYGAYLGIFRASHTGVKSGSRCVPCEHNKFAVPDGWDCYLELRADLRQPTGV